MRMTSGPVGERGLGKRNSNIQLHWDLHVYVWPVCLGSSLLLVPTCYVHGKPLAPGVACAQPKHVSVLFGSLKWHVKRNAGMPTWGDGRLCSCVVTDVGGLV